MKETSLEKRVSATLKEKAQYSVAFGIVAVMLYVIGFPVFILFFFGILAFFIWKAFSFESRNETRKIFEFYLCANEILRDDDRRWYGFEIQDAIARGEAILSSMSVAPPLVHFSLGSLYQKIADHSSAFKHLVYVLEESGSDESAIVYPTKDLREYVRILRKIERTPAEAPLTSAAVRSLERSRKNRGKDLLETSRLKASEYVNHLSDGNAESVIEAENIAYETEQSPNGSTNKNETIESERGITYRFADIIKPKKSRKVNSESVPPERKTISEVLHDIYDKNVP